MKTSIQPLSKIKRNIKFMPLGNRDVSASHIQKMKDSIYKYGIIRCVVLISTKLFNDKEKTYYIADGQHLYLACESLNLKNELHAIIVDDEFTSIDSIVNFVSQLNSTQKGWRLLNYIGAYASTNEFLDYNFLQNRILKYNLGTVTTAMLYGGYGSNPASRAIKTGQYTNRGNIAHADKVAEYLQDMILIVGRRNSSVVQNLAMAFFHWYNEESYNHQEFLEILKNKIEYFRTNDEDGIRGLLETIG